MTDTIQAIARSLSADVKTLGVISQNVANMNTPAYRAVRSVPAFDDGSDLHTSLDLRDGGVKQTDNKLDLALHGPGFFVIQRDGKTMLTRAGAFRLDADSQLVTERGDRVLGDSGPMTLSTGNVRVDAHGEIWDGTQSLGQLQIVDVGDPSALRPAGEGAYLYDGLPAEWTGSVAQGAIEQANVDPADETIRLMETTRHAESVQRAISIYDKAMDTGINHLGDN
ncbi:MAG TPA: flagellar hook basal-body protein [Xanthomonadaceae bacterium]|jgi:flagellar basal-body rod protein FlgG